MVLEDVDNVTLLSRGGSGRGCSATVTSVT